MPKRTEPSTKKKKTKRSAAKGPFVIYALRHTHKTEKSYIGQTNNFLRRIRQHNGLIAGGARWTKGGGPVGKWEPIFHVKGFQTIRAALQFEIACKKRHVPVRFNPGGGAAEQGAKARTRGPSGRVRQLEYLLSLGKLNDEPHSDFAANKISVEVFVTKAEYLKMGRMSAEDFEQARRQQAGVNFTFN